MKIQTKLIFLLMILFLITLAWFLFQHHNIKKGLTVLMRAEEEELTATLSKLIDLKGRPLQLLVNDYTFWDEMVRFVRSPERSWSTDNLDPLVTPAYGLDVVWIHDLAGRTVYSINDFSAAQHVPPLPVSAREQLLERRRTLFYMDTAEGLLEIRGATIHPSADPERKSEPQGTLFAGRLWDKEYLSDIENILRVKLSVIPLRADAGRPSPEGLMLGQLSARKIFRDMAGNPVMEVRAQKLQSQVGIFYHFFRHSLWALILFGVAITIVVFISLIRWLGLPLKDISLALRHEKTEYLKRLSGEKTEFGEMARLISSFFNQRGLLQRTIDNIPHPLFYLNPNGFFELSNKAFADFIGVKKSQLPGKRFGETDLPPGLGIVIGELDMMLPQGTISYETAILCSDRVKRDIVVTKTAVLGTGGGIDGLLVTLMDVTQRNKMGEVMRASEAKYRTLVQNLNVGVYRNSAKIMTGCFLEANLCLAQIFGYDSIEELMSIPVAALYQNPEERRIFIRTIRTKGFVKSMELRLKKKDGTPIWCAISARVHYDREGEIEWIDGVVEDITERKKMELQLRNAKEEATNNERVLQHMLIDLHETYEDLKKAQHDLIQRQEELMIQKEKEVVLREQAEEAVKLKSEFLANVSHEVRTPLNIVMGFMALLQKTSLNDKQQRYVETIRQGGKDLLTVINNILDFEKANSGRTVLDEVDFDLKGLVDDLSHSLEDFLTRKNLRGDYHIAEDVPRHLLGDEVRLKQILRNLLYNAVKFTSQGFVRLEIALEEKMSLGEGQESCRLRFTITDSGIGISPEQQKRIFEPFVQADGTATRRFGGTGLGLAICASYARLMGGDIDVRSEVNKGSQFTFRVVFKIKAAS